VRNVKGKSKEMRCERPDQSKLQHHIYRMISKSIYRGNVRKQEQEGEVRGQGRITPVPSHDTVIGILNTSLTSSRVAPRKNSRQDKKSKKRGAE